MRANFQQTLMDYGLDYTTAKSLGAPMLACTGMIVPDIAPHLALLITNFPRPVTTYTEPVEFAYAGGLQATTTGVPKTSHTGNLQFIETDFGQAQGFMELLMAHGGVTDCTVYDGRPDRWMQAYQLHDCAITFEPSEFDAEGRSTLLKVSAPMSYMYFGLNTKLGTSGVVNQITGASNVVDQFLNKANQTLNIVRAGNNIVRALGDLF
ncbi:hypothetical protein [Acinetobacter sp. CFCC 10889]|uniref:hypothetical protein n=1 Tax=Acinetobacter sp. CFCC 10889 TaxID=1775557 RepID=UPI000DD04BC5|nr:hypothetical protein [Acinetobacter sp. CFCC 10889]